MTNMKLSPKELLHKAQMACGEFDIEALAFLEAMYVDQPEEESFAGHNNHINKLMAAAGIGGAFWSSEPVLNCNRVGRPEFSNRKRCSEVNHDINIINKVLINEKFNDSKRHHSICFNSR